MYNQNLKEHNIYHNLAIEEYLFNSTPLDSPALFLWQSDCAVVIGKHQNPWKECLVDKLKKDSIPIARRISGGGTVFHDNGNLNYTIIMKQDEYDSQIIYDMIFKVLETFSLEGKVENKSNLCIEGKKFSGNAFAFRKKRVLHHGTLLVDADLNKLRYYLQPHYEGIETKAIASIPASVANLKDLNSEITIQTLSDSLKKSFLKLFAGKIIDSIEGNPEIEIIEKRVKSNKWIFEKTPDFTLQIDGKKQLIKNGIFK